VGLADWDLRPPFLQYRDATTGRDRYEELMLKMMRLMNSSSAENYGGRRLPPSVKNHEITCGSDMNSFESILLSHAPSITLFEKTLFFKDDLTACYLLHSSGLILHCIVVFSPISTDSFQLFQTNAPPPSMIDANASSSAGVSRILRTERAVCQMLWRQVQLKSR
jgi:hypothetical protein